MSGSLKRLGMWCLQVASRTEVFRISVKDNVDCQLFHFLGPVLIRFHWLSCRHPRALAVISISTSRLRLFCKHHRQMVHLLSSRHSVKPITQAYWMLLLLLLEMPRLSFRSLAISVVNALLAKTGYDVICLSGITCRRASDANTVTKSLDTAELCHDTFCLVTRASLMIIFWQTDQTPFLKQ